MLIEPEQWKPVVGFEGLYEVSDHGRVRSLPRVVVLATRWGGTTTARRNGGELRPQVQFGYPRVALQSAGRPSRVAFVHDLVLTAFVGPRPDGCESRHLNGDRSECALSNLAWGTKIENMADRDRHGTTVRGERMNTAKLNPDRVVAIRSAYAAGNTTMQRLADANGVWSGTISSIINRKSWKHVYA